MWLRIYCKIWLWKVIVRCEMWLRDMTLRCDFERCDGESEMWLRDITLRCDFQKCDGESEIRVCDVTVRCDFQRCDGESEMWVWDITLRCDFQRCEGESEMWVWDVTLDVTLRHVTASLRCDCEMSFCGRKIGTSFACGWRIRTIDSTLWVWHKHVISVRNFNFSIDRLLHNCMSIKHRGHN